MRLSVMPLLRYSVLGSLPSCVNGSTASEVMSARRCRTIHDTHRDDERRRRHQRAQDDRAPGVRRRRNRPASPAAAAGTAVVHVALESLEIRTQIGGALITQLAVLLERATDDAFELERNRRGFSCESDVAPSRGSHWRSRRPCCRETPAVPSPSRRAPRQRKRDRSSASSASARSCSGDM